MALIQVSPEELRSKSISLRASISRHDDAMREIDSIVNALDTVWKGPAQTAFVEKYRSMKGKFADFSEMLESYAKMMDHAAIEMEQADMNLASKIRI